MCIRVLYMYACMVLSWCILESRHAALLYAGVGAYSAGWRGAGMSSTAGEEIPTIYLLSHIIYHVTMYSYNYFALPAYVNIPSLPPCRQSSLGASLASG